MAKFTSLIAKLAAAKEGSRELDRLVFDATTNGVFGPENSDLWCYSGSWASRAPAHFTTSVDAALALIEKRLPGALYRMEKMGDVGRRAYGHPCWATCGLSGRQEEAVAATMPVAICIALLTALSRSQSPSVGAHEAPSATGYVPTHESPSA